MRTGAVSAYPTRKRLQSGLINLAYEDPSSKDRVVGMSRGKGVRLDRELRLYRRVSKRSMPTDQLTCISDVDTPGFKPRKVRAAILRAISMV